MKRTPDYLVLSLAILFLALGCAKLERNNLLDPKNPNSVRKQVILAELFVNDSLVSHISIDTVYDTTWCDSTGYSRYLCDSTGCDSHMCDSARYDSLITDWDSIQCSLYYCDSSWCDTSWCDSIPQCSLVNQCDSCTTSTGQDSLCCQYTPDCYDITATAIIETIYDTTKYVYPECSNAEAGLESLYYHLQSSYLVYAQYHVRQDTAIDGLETNDGEKLYTQYQDLSPNTGPVPRVFINGPSQPLALDQAASATEVYNSVNDTVSGLLDQDNHFTLEGSHSVSGLKVTVTGKIARLGSKDYDDTLSVYYIVMEDLGAEGHHFVVRGFSQVPVYGIQAGDIRDLPAKSVTFPDNADPSAARAIICVKAKNQTVLQAVLLP
jgi:hypothetical protein